MPFALSADAFDGFLGPEVSRVGVKADTEHAPCFKGVSEHEEFGLAIGGGADGGAGEPCVADFAGVGHISPVALVAHVPGPEFDIPEAGRSDESAVALADDCKRQRCAGILPAKRGGNIVGGFFVALGNRAPLVEGWICG